MMRLYRTTNGAVLEKDGSFYLLWDSWDALVSRDNLPEHLQNLSADDMEALVVATPGSLELRPPVAGQEVWAAGVGYEAGLRGRGTPDESRDAPLYRTVCESGRPDLMFKASPYRVRGHREAIRIRRDSRRHVAEPEVTLVLSSGGRVVGYTVGNDVTARDLVAENLLYLPQAKIYEGSCAVGPGILVATEELPPETPIRIRVERGGETVFQDSSTYGAVQRPVTQLVEYLYRELMFPRGCLLMTGTGILPPEEFSLEAGDEVRISIPPVGSLINPVTE
ncbi:MAG TPA: fumarylacetoacetate hydrolase family protein [Acidobacteriota bacterium]|jgi:2-dehydro-3-deoxy-D-arabinonate dehydratase|nr:fumarylacetoacetate hydrolase family protein [Acidobacteriota bacterium]